MMQVLWWLILGMVFFSVGMLGGQSELVSEAYKITAWIQLGVASILWEVKK